MIRDQIILFTEKRDIMPQGPRQYRKKCVTFLRGGGGLQKNVHMTFLVDKIDM